MAMLALPDGILAYRDRGRGVPVTACHGFALAGAAWSEVAAAVGAGWRWLLPDLRGHGATTVPPDAPHTLEAAADDLVRLWDALGIGRSHLVGYSMGARVALALAVRDPERCRSLVVISGHAGLEPAGRPGRRDADRAWGERLLHDGTERFADAWEALPLFAGVARRGAPARARLARIRRRSRPEGLAASLRDSGAGAMAPLWDRLQGVRCPTLVVAGAEDPRYLAYAARLVGALPRAELVVVPRCGHAVPAERPHLLGRVLAAFLRSAEAGGA